MAILFYATFVLELTNTPDVGWKSPGRRRGRPGFLGPHYFQPGQTIRVAHLNKFHINLPPILRTIQCSEDSFETTALFYWTAK